MTDTYFSASTYDALAGVLTTVQNGHIALAYQNVLGPLPGRAAVAATTDSGGNAIPAIPAAGDASLWYVGIRSNASLSPPAGVTICDTSTGQAVLGVWA